MKTLKEALFSRKNLSGIDTIYSIKENDVCLSIYSDQDYCVLELDDKYNDFSIILNVLEVNSLLLSVLNDHTYNIIKNSKKLNYKRTGKKHFISLYENGNFVGIKLDSSEINILYDNLRCWYNNLI